jgi:hypothetical protein
MTQDPRFVETPYQVPLMYQNVSPSTRHVCPLFTWIADGLL